ncbi:MAG TPA: DUF3348 family protein [Ramlibacter sp.]
MQRALRLRAAAARLRTSHGPVARAVGGGRPPGSFLIRLQCHRRPAPRGGADDRPRGSTGGATRRPAAPPPFPRRRFEWRRPGAEDCFLQSTFSSSRLVRLVGEWSPLAAEAPGMDFAERLSLWLNAFDAIGLQAAHQSIKAVTAPASRNTPAAPRGHAQSPEADLQRVRSALAHAIAQDPLPPGAPEADGSAWRQRHGELQRHMEQMIAPLREHVRQVMSRRSGRLRQLAALDAALEQWLAPREQAVLPAVAAVAERRFEQLRREHRQAIEASGAQDDPARWREPGGWLHAFERDWRQALLAELDLRLEPVAGLVEAWSNEAEHRT